MKLKYFPRLNLSPSELQTMYNMPLTTAHVLYKGREMTFETVQQLFLPPSCGALVLIAVKLPLILWLIPYKKERQKTCISGNSLSGQDF